MRRHFHGWVTKSRSGGSMSFLRSGFRGEIQGTGPRMCGQHLSLFSFFETGNFIETLFSRRVLFSIRLSLITATAATILSVAIGLPAAYGLSRDNFRGKQG